MDRLSRAGIELAKLAAAEGAIVVFEPSAKSDPKLFKEALNVAHIVKYASQRMPKIDDIMANGTSVLLEVQTLGSDRPRYRHRFDDRPSAWVRMDAVHVPKLADTCGAGDWCTAGLIAKAAAGGLAGLTKGGADSVQQALRFGQTLAAWNCGFEGARGGMYAVTREVFDANIEDLLEGRESTAALKPASRRTVTVSCPACPPVSFRRRRAHSGRRKRAA